MTTIENNQKPSDKVLKYAFELSIKEDKPILSDYWNDSHIKKCFIGFKENGEKFLVKNKEEFTSTIVSIPKLKDVSDEYIVVTENSIYLISSKIEKRKVK